MLTGDTVPASGIYKVRHEGHRLPHEVTLLQGQAFPRCSKCEDRVTFEIVRVIPELGDRRERITVYELPTIEHENPPESVA